MGFGEWIFAVAIVQGRFLATSDTHGAGSTPIAFYMGELLSEFIEFGCRVLNVLQEAGDVIGAEKESSFRGLLAYQAQDLGEFDSCCHQLTRLARLRQGGQTGAGRNSFQKRRLPAAVGTDKKTDGAAETKYVEIA